MVDIYHKNPLASFAFRGATRPEEDEPEVTPENMHRKKCMDQDGSQRHRVYKKKVRKHFSPIIFSHADSDENNLYILYNRDYVKQQDHTHKIDTIVELFLLGN